MVIDDQDSQLHESMVPSNHSRVIRASPEASLKACSDVPPQTRTYVLP